MDIIITSPTDFHSTEISFKVISPKGGDIFQKLFGHGVESVTMPKSNGLEFIEKVRKMGVRMVKDAVFGCRSCLWHGVECCNHKHFEADVYDNKPTCKAYMYND